MADDKQWTDEDLRLWAYVMYIEPLKRAQAESLRRSVERSRLGFLLNNFNNPHRR